MVFLGTVASMSMEGRSTCVTLWIGRVINRRKAPLIHYKVRDLVGGSTDITHVHKSFFQSLGQGCMFPHGNALCTRPWAY